MALKSPFCTVETHAWLPCRYYVAELVKLYPLLSAAWGVMLFKEFKGVGRKAMLLFGVMCGAYLLGVILLAFSRNHSSVA